MLDLEIIIYTPIFEEGTYHERKHNQKGSLYVIIWKGFGILNIVIPGVIFIVVSAIISSLGLNSIDSRLPLAFVFIVSGVIIWHLGKALNAKSGKVLVDMETGEHYRMGTEHSLFFIPMHYWGPVGLVLGFILTVATIFT